MGRGSVGQVSSVLRRVKGGYAHWCPACEEAHVLPDTWSFDGDLERPSFSPSFKHEGVRRVFDPDGRWTGEWVRNADGSVVPFTCHYNLKAGILEFCQDCTHSMANSRVPLPRLPAGLVDPGFEVA